MNHTCKVCDEPAAGFHFGQFTCEGCKSFFGRTYNNLSSIQECKNGSQCVINKKNRTSCKACRLRKCLMVGMSKSGSRYGRRSNWFKIHCLLQERAGLDSALHASALNGLNGALRNLTPGKGLFESKENQDELQNWNSPSLSSPDSHISDNSLEVCDNKSIDSRPYDKPINSLSPISPSYDTRDFVSRIPMTPLSSIISPGFPPSPFHPHSYLFNPPGYIIPKFSDASAKKQFIDEVLDKQKITPGNGYSFSPQTPPEQDKPMDLSVRKTSIDSDENRSTEMVEEQERKDEVGHDTEPLPLDLTTRT